MNRKLSLVSHLSSNGSAFEEDCGKVKIGNPKTEQFQNLELFFKVKGQGQQSKHKTYREKTFESTKVFKNSY